MMDDPRQILEQFVQVVDAQGGEDTLRVGGAPTRILKPEGGERTIRDSWPSMLPVYRAALAWLRANPAPAPTPEN
jgi:hypothetical protein